MKIQSGKTFVIAALVISIAMPFSVFAAPSAGIKPSSIFYFLDIASEQVSIFFTFGSEKKARKALEYADERLAEAEAVAGDKNTDAVKTAITNYESNIAFAAEKSKDIKEKEKAEALLTTISDSTSRHQEVLADVLAKVPDEAKEAITKAIEASRRGQEEALQKIAELKGKVEQLKQGVAELKQSNNDKQSGEIEKLKKEIEELKKQQLPPVLVKKQDTFTKQEDAKSQSTQLPTTTKEDNFSQVLINAYSDYSKTLKDWIELMESNKSFLSDRIDKISSRIENLKRTYLDANKYGADADVIREFNGILDDYIAMHNRDISATRQRVDILNQYLSWLNNTKGQYDASKTYLISNPIVFMGREKFIEAAEGYLKNVDPSLDKISENSRIIREHHIDHMDSYDKQYQKTDAAMLTFINTLISRYSTSVSYEPYRPAYIDRDADIQRYIERAERILNPVRCETRGDIIGGSYNAYTTCY